MTLSPHGLVSTALDRYVRIHSTFPPPNKVGNQQEKKGEVLGKIFVNSTPTASVWDPTYSHGCEAVVEEEADVWESMQGVNDT